MGKYAPPEQRKELRGKLKRIPTNRLGNFVACLEINTTM
jgi:hypothetical protein